MTTLLAEDVVWTVASQSLLARTFTGKADVFGKFFAGLGECSGGSLSIEIETVVANDQTVVVLSHHNASHGGAQLDAHEIDVYAIRGGRVAEARSMSIEPSATSAFYGRRVTRLSDPPAQFGLVGYVATVAWRASRRSPRTPFA